MRPSRPSPAFRHLVARTAALAATVAAAAVVIGADAPAGGVATTRPAASRPLLEQLNRETQDLYRSLDRSVVRVQLPQVATELAYQDNRLNRYRLNDAVRQQLANQTAQRRSDPATQPAAAQSQVLGGNNAVPPQQGVVIVMPTNGVELPPNLLSNNRAANTPPAQPTPVAPNAIGIVLDEQGHVLVPAYVEREAAAAQPARVVGPAGEVVDARYVGADAQTSLTVFQLGAAGKKAATEKAAVPAFAFLPVKLSEVRPAEGALVLFLSPADGAGRLGVWAAAREPGVVVGIDGEMLGVSRPGQFVSGVECRFVADQLIRTGVVKRSSLGVTINRVEKDDPLRAGQPALGGRPAIRVDRVTPGSAADRGGLRTGDVILSLDGQPVTDLPALAAAVAARSGKTPLGVLREGREMEVVVELEPK